MQTPPRPASASRCADLSREPLSTTTISNSGHSRESATALIVSYNTRELTAFLLWSLRTIVS